MFPIGDAPNPRGFRPWVNWALIAVNIAVFVFISLPASQTPGGYEALVLGHGFIPAQPTLSDLFSSLFLHGGLAHLAGNMLFLWIYGDNVEHALGRIPYLIAYLACGVAATVAFSVVAQGSTVPLIGASGAISGVLGFYFVLFPRNRVRLLLLWPFFRVMMVPARLVLGFYVLIDNVLPIVLGSSSNVAYGAHLGGFFAGLGVALLVRGLRHQAAGRGGPRVVGGRGPTPAQRHSHYAARQRRARGG